LQAPFAVRAERFRQQREVFHARLVSRWPHGIDDPFDLLAPVSISRADVQSCYRASAAILHIYARVVAMLPRLPNDAVKRLGYVAPLMRLCQRSGAVRHVPIARLDLVRTRSGYKLLDFNADAPGYIFEAGAVNAHACAANPDANPNAALDRYVRNAFAAAIRRWCREHRRSEASVVVRCGYASGSADQRALAEYYADLCSNRYDSRPMALERLSTDGLQVRGENGQTLDVLIRCAPLLSFLGGIDLALVTGRQILRLASRGRLCLLNPLEAHLFENKAVQALIWGLYELGLVFNTVERATIARHFLPTYLMPPQHQAGRWVAKPVLDACGAGVSIGLKRPIRLPKDGYVYQRYAPLDRRTLMTETGLRRLTTVVSCVVAHGEPVGITMRAGGPVTDMSAWSVPVRFRTPARNRRLGHNE
jgi:glutathionylspermidine synthase